MPTAAYITFQLALNPIKEPKSKFGGSPVWLQAPEWPISKKTGEPMLFIGQIRLSRDLFGETRGIMAYLFITDNPKRNLDTSNPDGGENAVIIQPGNNAHIMTRSIWDGRSIYRLEKGKRKFLLRKKIQVPGEYDVILENKIDPPVNEKEDDPYRYSPHDLAQCKIGGVPVWIQGEDRKFQDSRKLLLQLVSYKFPFELYLSDTGTLYVFLNSDGTKGVMTWQCY